MQAISFGHLRNRVLFSLNLQKPSFGNNLFPPKVQFTESKLSQS